MTRLDVLACLLFSVAVLGIVSAQFIPAVPHSWDSAFVAATTELDGPVTGTIPMNLILVDVFYLSAW
jgi:hypothetical protein